ncbi:MAG: hypothetical protein LBR55_07560 [Bacteroidales bacterium]|jgi:hypothetical protein|nr:hypothetical protein [Bacteroidales bacterium]
MKRNLFTVAAGLLIGFGASAQDVNLYEYGDGWSVIDSTVSHKVMTGFTKANGLTSLEGGVVDTDGDAGSYDVSWNSNDEVVRIDYTKLSEADHYQSVNFMFIEWNDCGDATRTEKHASYTTTTDIASVVEQEAEAMVAKGNIVDFSDPGNAYISLQYRTPGYSGAFNMRFDLRDISGRTTNGTNSNIMSDSFEGTEEWTNLLFSWEGNSDWLPTNYTTAEVDNNGKIVMYDQYSGDWFGTTNPWSATEGKPLASDKIVGFLVTLFDGPSNGTMGNNISIEFRDIVLGNKELETPFVWESVDSPNGFKTVNGAELQVVNGVVYSAGQIVVTSITGQVVAVANGEFNTNSLTNGIYLIKAAEGTAKIVK